MSRRPVVVLFVAESRRRFRSLRADSGKMALYGAFGSLLVLALPFLLGAALTAGRDVATDSAGDPVAVTGVVVGVLVLFVAAMEAVSVLQEGLLPGGAESFLLAVSHREAVLALVGVETAKVALIVGVPGLLTAVAFGIGAGSIAGFAGVALVVVLATAVAAVLGVAMGVAVRTGVARVPALAKYRNALAATTFVGYLALVSSGAVDGVFGAAMALVGVTPLGWFGHLALVAVVPSASPTLAAVVLVGTVVAVGALFGLTSLLTASRWYETAVEPTAGETESAMSGVPGLGRPRSHVARRAWLRARRSPIRLLYVVYPLVFFVAPLAQVVQSGRLPTWMPPAFAVYDAWAAGAAFTLNPIGDEVPTLPVTVISPVDGRTYVEGLWLAGALVGGPATLLVTLLTGVGAGLAPPDLLAVCLAGTALGTLAPGLAAGTGATFPKTDRSNVLGNIQAVTPSAWAFGTFSIALGVLSLPVWATVPGGARDWLAGQLGVGIGVVYPVAGLATVALVGFGALAGRRVAARRFDTYTGD